MTIEYASILPYDDLQRIYGTLQVVTIFQMSVRSDELHIYIYYLFPVLILLSWLTGTSCTLSLCHLMLSVVNYYGVVCKVDLC